MSRAAGAHSANSIVGVKTAVVSGVPTSDVFAQTLVDFVAENRKVTFTVDAYPDESLTEWHLRHGLVQ